MSHPPAASPDQEAQLNEACAALLRNRRGADGDDVAQEACLRALQLPPTRHVRDPIRYLLRIVRNLVVDRHRAKVRETALVEALAVVESNSSAAADPERILAGKQELGRVLAEIAALPPRCRQAFMLHRFKGLSYSATARTMGISTSMVEKHIAEAMLRLHRAWHKEGRP